MKYVILAIILLLIILFVALLVISYKIYSKLCKVSNKNVYKDFKKRNIDISSIYVEPNIEWLKEQEIKNVYMTSRDGLKLHGVYLPAVNPYRTVICIHGYRGSYDKDFSAIIRYLNANHSNVLLVEQRGHGESQGNIITFGAKEKLDVVDWVNYVLNKIDDRYPIYLYGLSMGSSTALLSLGAGINSRVRGVIADSGYSSFSDMLAEISNKWYGVSAFPVVGFVGMYCNLLGGFSIKETDTKKALKENNVPILFIHGEKDEFISGENTRINYTRTPGPKDVLWVSDANHIESVIKNPEMYHNKLEIFFDKYK